MALNVPETPVKIGGGASDGVAATTNKILCKIDKDYRGTGNE
jgi:hypothetical protein